MHRFNSICSLPQRSAERDSRKAKVKEKKLNNEKDAIMAAIKVTKSYYEIFSDKKKKSVFNRDEHEGYSQSCVSHHVFLVGARNQAPPVCEASSVRFRC